MYELCRMELFSSHKMPEFWSKLTCDERNGGETKQVFRTNARNSAVHLPELINIQDEKTGRGRERTNWIHYSRCRAHSVT